MIVSIILLSMYCNPYFIGIFSTFPTLLISTLIILTLNQGKEFAQAISKVLILSSTNVVIYSISVYYIYPSLGITIGTIVSYIISALYILFLNPITKTLK